MIGRPSLMSRYLVSRFLAAFAFLFGLLLILVFLADTFDRLNLLIKQTGAGFGTLFFYLWLNVPVWAMRAVPVATLVAALSTASDFIRSGEWLAAQAAGFRPFELARQMLVGALLITAATFAAQETVLPAAREKAAKVFDRRLRPPGEAGTVKDILLIADADTFLMAREFDFRRGTLTRAVLDQYKDARLWRQMDARVARWDPRAAFWVFEDGVLREFGELSQPIREKDFRSEVSGLRVPPKELNPRKWEPDSMGIKELLRHIRRLERLGVSTEQAVLALHFKLAYPFSNLVLAALAIPVAFRSRRAGRWSVAAGALGIAFAFWCSLSIAEGLAKAGALPDPVAAWSANVLFAAAAIWLYRRTESFS